MSSETKQAMDTLKKSMKKDLNYAWAWHCTLACMLLDEGAGHKKANDRAADFMKRIFDIDIVDYDPDHLLCGEA